MRALEKDIELGTEHVVCLHVDHPREGREDDHMERVDGVAEPESQKLVAAACPQRDRVGPRDDAVDQPHGGIEERKLDLGVGGRPAQRFHGVHPELFDERHKPLLRLDLGLAGQLLVGIQDGCVPAGRVERQRRQQLVDVGPDGRVVARNTLENPDDKVVRVEHKVHPGTPVEELEQRPDGIRPKLRDLLDLERRSQRRVPHRPPPPTPPPSLPPGLVRPAPVVRVVHPQQIQNSIHPPQLHKRACPLHAPRLEHPNQLCHQDMRLRPARLDPSQKLLWRLHPPTPRRPVPSPLSPSSRRWPWR